MGAVGRLAGAIGGQQASYGMARHPGMPGRYMDVALHNRAAPGQPATQSVPKGLHLGERIDLLARKRDHTDNSDDSGGHGLGLNDGGTYTVRYYWGCGEQARSGQPRQYSMTVRNGTPVQSGSTMTPRTIPDRGPDIDPEYVLWPNPATRHAVPDKASLVGTHRIDGTGVPASMQFALGAGDDFLPKLELEQSGTPADGIALQWKGVEGARAYFIHAMATQGDTVVMWSSSEDGYAGPELIDYLPEALVSQWTTKRTLLGADARTCTIPREVFADTEGAPMVQMIAYGNERTVTGPRPANAAQGSAIWTVRVRSKSTAMLMPGLGAGTAREAARPAAKDAAKDAAKSVLRGLFGR